MKNTIKNCGILFSSLLIFLTVFTACDRSSVYEINIAEQFGIAYAPLQIMKQQSILEKKLPGITVNWKQFGGPTAIREGMLAGEIDIGFMGPAPALMGIDTGMEWKIATGISMNEVHIIAKDPDIQTLADLEPDDRIAILSPACTQHVLLCMAAKKEFGDPNYLDNRLVSLSHPDAMNALLSDTEVTVHVATPPYSSMEMKAGMHSIYTGEELMGMPFTFITGVALERFYSEKRDIYDAFLESLNEAIDYINNNMDKAVITLAPIYGITEDELREQMTQNGTIFSNRLQGIEAFTEAMYEMGFTKENPSFEDITFSNVDP